MCEEVQFERNRTSSKASNMTENNYALEDLHNMCRLCLSTTALVSIFDDRLESKENMRDIVEVTTGVKILPNDEVSHMLCDKCFHLTVRMYKFKNTSMLNDLELKEKASNRKKVHKSVQDMLRQDPKLIIPASITKSNIAPVVMLDRNVTDFFKAKIQPLKRKISRDQQLQMFDTNNGIIIENPAKKLKSTVEFDSSSADATIQHLQDQVSPPIERRNLDFSFNPVGKEVIQEMDKKLKDKDNELPFTIKTITKSLFICDECNKVHYNTKELKKHKTKHMHCSLCRTSFGSMEDTKEHENYCSVKIIMNNQPQLIVKRCDQIEEIREKYRKAFRNFLIIEISDDESETDHVSPKKNSNTESITNLASNVKNSSEYVDVDKSDEVSKMGEDGAFESPTRGLSKKRPSLEQASKVIEESNGSENIEKPTSSTNPVKSKLQEKFRRISMHIEHEEKTKSVNPSGHNEEYISEMSDLNESNDTERPETLKEKCDPEASKKIPHLEKSELHNHVNSDVERSKEVKEPGSSGKLHAKKSNVEPFEGKAFENSKTVHHIESQYNKEKSDGEIAERKAPQNSGVKLNHSSSNNLKESGKLVNPESSHIKKFKEIGEPEMSNKKFNPVSSRNGSNLKGSNKSNPEIPNVHKSRAIKDSQASKREYLHCDNLISSKSKDFSEGKSDPAKSNSMSHIGESEKEIEVLKISEGESNSVKSNIDKSEETKKRPETSTEKSKDKNSEVISLLDESDNEFDPKEYHIEVRDETDKTEKSEVKSNPEGSETISPLIKSEKLLDLENDARKSDELVSTDKPNQPPSHKSSYENTERIEPSVDLKEVHKSENRKLKKRKMQMEENTKNAKKSKSQVSLKNKNKINLTLQKNDESPSIIKTFKPDISFGELDVLEVDEVDDDNTYLVKLLRRIKNSKGMVNEAVQTSLPSNSDIINLKGNMFLYELQNLRSYLNFSQIPVNISYAKIPSIKYNYEPSSLMKSQEKLKCSMTKKSTSSGGNKSNILVYKTNKRNTEKISESGLGIKEVGSNSSNVSAQPISFESNIRIESVTTLSLDPTASNMDDKNDQPGTENACVSLNNTNSTQTSDHKKSVDIANPTIDHNPTETDTSAGNNETTNKESNEPNLEDVLTTTTSNCFPVNNGNLNTIIAPRIINPTPTNNAPISFLSYPINNMPVQNSMITPTQFYLIKNSGSKGIVSAPMTMISSAHSGSNEIVSAPMTMITSAHSGSNEIVSAPMTMITSAHSGSNEIVSAPMKMITSAPLLPSNPQPFSTNNALTYGNVNSSVNMSVPDLRLTPEVPSRSTPRLPPPLRQIRFKYATTPESPACTPSSQTKMIIPEMRAGPSFVPQSIRPHVMPRSTSDVMQKDDPSNQVFAAPAAPPSRRISSTLPKIRIGNKVVSRNIIKLYHSKTTKNPSYCDKLEQNKKKCDASIQNEPNNHAVSATSETTKYIRVKSLSELK